MKSVLTLLLLEDSEMNDVAVNGMLVDVQRLQQWLRPGLSPCRGNVGEILDQKDQRGVKAALLRDLDLEQVLDRDVEHLSGGELQRFAIAVVAAQQADVYMIDEPSSYLDVRQRLKAAQVGRPRKHHCSR